MTEARCRRTEAPGPDGVEGTVFNIQRFSTHDGPGIRTTVFLKGCPLHCGWCHNPESNENVPQLAFYEHLCSGCGACAPACERKAVTVERKKARTDRSRCAACGACVAVCPNKAREILGFRTSAGSVMEEADKDRAFYLNSGGGITLSGGEPLWQPAFTCALLEAAKERGYHTAVETSGFASKEVAKTSFQNTDLILFDIKHMDSGIHKKLTGVPNEPIHENLRMAAGMLKKDIWLRLPLIQGINDSKEEISRAAQLAAELGERIQKVCLLPYHDLGISKLEAVGRSRREMEGYEAPSQEHMEELLDLWKKYGFDAVIG